MNLRSSGAQLPSADELFAILRSESSRLAVKTDYVSKNFDLYDGYKALCRAADANSDWLESYSELSLDSLLRQIDETQLELKDFIITHQRRTDLYDCVFDSLVLPDDDVKSDAIFVFGAGTNARIERAVELYFQGVSDRIIISGSRPFYSTNEFSEAQRMADFATSKGVPSDAILLEDKSITLPDNVKRTLDLFETQSWKPASITYVVTNYVMRRAGMEWYKYTPWKMECKPVAARQISPDYSSEHWYEDDHVRSLILNEYIKIIFESKMDLIRAEINRAT